MNKNNSSDHAWKQITLRPRKDSRLGEILRYMEQTKFEELDQEIKNLLRAVFSVPALKGKVSQERLEKIGHECIGLLQGYIDGIEKQAQISTKPAIAPLQLVQSAVPTNGNGVSATNGNGFNGRNGKTENSQPTETESAVDKANRRLEMTEELFSH